MGAFIAPLTGQLNAPLSNYAQAYRQHALFSDVMFPRVPVGRQTDTYFIFGYEDQQLVQNTLRAPGAGAQRVRRAVSTDTYKAQSHALADSMPDESRANAEQAGLSQIVSSEGQVRYLQRLILVDKENAACVLANTAGNFGSNTVTLSGTDQWSDPDDSDPIGNVETAKQAIEVIGVEVTHMILGRKVFSACKKHDKIRDAFKYTQKGSITLLDLAAYFEIPNVSVGKAVGRNKSGTASKLFDENDVLLFFSDPNPSFEDLSFGKTFVWVGAPGTIGGYGVVEGREPDVTAKGGVIGVDFYYDQKITCAAAGYLIKDAAA